MWIKPYRYIQFDIETGDEPLVLQDYYNVFTAYPFEEEFIKPYLSSVRGILEYYEGFLDEKNLLNSLEWWQYTDAAYPCGMPPGTNDGNSVMLNLLYVYTMQQAVDLFEHFGWQQEAKKWQILSEKIQSAVNNNCYHSGRGLYTETPAKTEFAQHTNIFAAADDGHANSSLVMAAALRAAKVSVEAHIYPIGGHGYGLRPGNRAAIAWPALAKKWLEDFVLIEND